MTFHPHPWQFPKGHPQKSGKRQRKKQLPRTSRCPLVTNMHGMALLPFICFDLIILGLCFCFSCLVFWVWCFPFLFKGNGPFFAQSTVLNPHSASHLFKGLYCLNDLSTSVRVPRIMVHVKKGNSSCVYACDTNENPCS